MGGGGVDGPQYYLKLCCKQVAKLYNPCPQNYVGLKIDKCFEALGADPKNQTIQTFIHKLN